MTASGSSVLTGAVGLVSRGNGNRQTLIANIVVSVSIRVKGQRFMAQGIGKLRRLWSEVYRFGGCLYTPQSAVTTLDLLRHLNKRLREALEIICRWPRFCTAYTVGEDCADNDLPIITLSKVNQARLDTPTIVSSGGDIWQYLPVLGGLPRVTKTCKTSISSRVGSRKQAYS
jgi:hypothetical protein